MQFTVDLLSILEQGGVYSGGEWASNNRIRNRGYISTNGWKPNSVTVSAVSVNGKAIGAEFVGYSDSYANVCDLYWYYGNPNIIDLTNYNNISYFRLAFRYEDNSAISPSEITSCSVTINIADTWETGSDGYPMPINAPELPESYMVKPYPAIYWRIEENEEYPSNGLMPDLPANGAFANASELTQVSIPQSVKYIGEEAFRHTKLKSVTIASDCTYFDTSFPEGCEIKFY